MIMTKAQINEEYGLDHWVDSDWEDLRDLLYCGIGLDDSVAAINEKLEKANDQ